MNRLFSKFSTLIINWQFLLLALVTPFLLFPSPRRSLVLLLIPALYLLTLLINKKSTLSPLNLPLLLLLFMVLVSLYATYDIGVSFPNIAGLLLGVGFYFAFIQAARGMRGLQVPFLAYFAASMGVVLLSVFTMQNFQKIAFISPLLQWIPSGLITLPGEEAGIHPNIVAGALLWFLPLILVLFVSLLLKGKEYLKKIRPWQYGFITALVFFSLLFVTIVFILTQSRSAYLGLLITLLLSTIFLFPKKLRALVAIILIILMIFGIWFSIQQGWAQLLFDSVAATGGLTSLSTLNGRVEIWSRAIYAIQDFSFTGMGMDTFRSVVNVLYPLQIISADSPIKDIGHAHNEFLQAALDLGIPGLIAFISIYFVAFSMLFQTYQRAGRRSISKYARGLDRILLSYSGIQAITIGLGLSLLAHMIYGLTDCIKLGSNPSLLFWMLLGLIAALHHLTTQKTEPQRNQTTK